MELLCLVRVTVRGEEEKSTTHTVLLCRHGGRIVVVCIRSSAGRHDQPVSSPHAGPLSLSFYIRRRRRGRQHIAATRTPFYNSITWVYACIVCKTRSCWPGDVVRRDFLGVCCTWCMIHATFPLSSSPSSDYLGI